MDVREVLSRVPGLRLDGPVETGMREDGAAVATAVVRMGTAALRLWLVLEDPVDPDGVEDRVARAAAGGPDGSVTVLAGTSIDPAIRRRLEAAGLSWLDGSGEVHLDDPPVVVHVEAAEGPGGSTRVETRMFGGAGGRVARVLLEDPEGRRGLEDISEAAGTDPGATARALTAFADAGFVERVEFAWRGTDPPGLFDAWMEHVRTAMEHDRPAERWFYRPESPTSLMRVTAQMAEESGLAVAFTGLAAAELIEPRASTEVVEAYVEPFAKAAAFGGLLGTAVPPGELDRAGANLRLVASTDGGAFVGARDAVVRGIPLVGRAQLVADLVLQGGSGGQVARSLRSRWSL